MPKKATSPAPATRRVATATPAATGSGLRINRTFTTAEGGPYAGIAWERRSSVITEPDGRVVFELHDIEVPSTWSQLATDILCSKYIRKAGVPTTGHETSARQVVERITHTLRDYAEGIGAFATREDAQAFEDELTYLLITQRAAFNSPVWFNLGLYHSYGIASGSGGTYYWNSATQAIEKTTNSYERPQCSACFIQKVDDSLESIFELVKSESRLFKFGSGTGSNFSKLRSKYEKLSGGGKSSGVMSFLEVLDRAAGSIKSGGTTRRAAKMVVLDIDHPEIKDFVEWKVKEEKKVAALVAAGYSSDFNGEAYHTVAGQNANNTVRVTDAFMEAVLKDKDWETRARTSGEVVHTYKARELWRDIAQAAWSCADPGLQYDTTINRWHTCSATDRINGSNPCSEYMFLDDTACNLASLNLMLFTRADGSLDTAAYAAANRIVFMAQEFLIDLSSYPTEPIARNSHEFRPLGLGYANLGTLLMCQGLPYDSEEGRQVAGAITALMHATGYKTSAELASVLGTFGGYAKNRKPFLRVMEQHRNETYRLDGTKVPQELLEAAQKAMDDMVAAGKEHGYRNAQATVLAPTGTIGLLMDCDTTGVEPEFSLIKWKKLSGGGFFKIVNQSIMQALQNLGYSTEERQGIIDYVLGRGTLEGAPHVNPSDLLKLGFSEDQIKSASDYVKTFKTLDDYTPEVTPAALKAAGLTDAEITTAQTFISGAQTMEGAPFIREEHLAVFDCANRCGSGVRFIQPMGHVKMMAAVQPFLSGAISKTVNMPSDTTIEDVEEMYMEGWKLGLKAVAIYRDGSKLSQPLNSSADKKKDDEDAGDGAVATVPVLPTDAVSTWGLRKPLPMKRRGFTLKTEIAGHDLYLRTGEYEDGQLGEIFLTLGKEGATLKALMDSFAAAVSIGLQHGVPLEKFVEKFTFTRFEPAGLTTHPNIKTATSLLDFVFRVLGMEYLGRTDFAHVQPLPHELGIPGRSTPVEGLGNAVHFEPAPTPAAAPTAGAPTIVGQPQSALDKQLSSLMGDAPLCNLCGHITVRNGACYKCLSCGNSLGCS